MNTRPRLTRSIPFWLLVAGSLASSAAGAVILIDKLGTMETALTAGTATGVEVYVGQIWAVLGAILIGVGAIGLLLAFTLGSLRAFATPREQVAPVAESFDDEIETEASDASATTEQPVLDGAAR
ncbi:dinucleotide-utilizing enzyme [Microbacterium oleivorans]|uniref:dinucleotide-utilizing enzyme n=1 Tax=Microbacterium oleivorans TaxID=273677 RepID=UPI00080EA7EA|nr:dinucleotide-utilizing enzyme [Microbacterium oleivorans]